MSFNYDGASVYSCRCLRHDKPCFRLYYRGNEPICYDDMAALVDEWKLVTFNHFWEAFPKARFHLRQLRCKAPSSLSERRVLQVAPSL